MELSASSLRHLEIGHIRIKSTKTAIILGKFIFYKASKLEVIILEDMINAYHDYSLMIKSFLPQKASDIDISCLNSLAEFAFRSKNLSFIEA